MPRRVEVFTDGREWRVIERADLAPGMVFRLFEEDGAPVVTTAALTGERVDHWRVLGVAPPPADAEPGREMEIQAEEIPETSVERQAREGGTYWPTGGAPRADWGPPRRLR